MYWILAFGGAGLIGLLVLFLVWPGSRRGVAPDVVQALQNRNVAHRGLHSGDGIRPENSLPAFQAACTAGYGIELDIQLSKDGAVVVFHDDDLARVCGVPQRVDDLTLRELKALRLLGSEQAIPTLAEVLATVVGQVPLVVELKKGPRNTLLCEKAADLLGQYQGPWCVESFDPRILLWWRRHRPGVLRGQLSAPPKALQSGLAGWAVGHLLTNALARPHFVAYQIGAMPSLARLVRRRTLRLAWTARPGDDAAAVQQANDAVIFELYRPPPHYEK